MSDIPKSNEPEISNNPDLEVLETDQVTSLLSGDINTEKIGQNLSASAYQGDFALLKKLSVEDKNLGLPEIVDFDLEKSSQALTNSFKFDSHQIAAFKGIAKSDQAVNAYFGKNGPQTESAHEHFLFNQNTKFFR